MKQRIGEKPKSDGIIGEAERFQGWCVERMVNISCERGNGCHNEPGYNIVTHGGGSKRNHGLSVAADLRAR